MTAHRRQIGFRAGEGPAAEVAIRDGATRAIARGRESSLPAYGAETREILRKMEGALAALEVCPHERELLDELYRSVSSLESSAGRGRFGSMREPARLLARLLERLRGLAEPMGPHHVRLLEKALVALDESASDAPAGAPEPRPQAAGLREQARSAPSSGGHGTIDLALQFAVGQAVPAGEDEAPPARPRE